MMLSLTLLEQTEVEYDGRDVAGWLAQTDTGIKLGTVTQMMINTELDLVTVLRVNDALMIPINQITLGDGVVIAHHLRFLVR